MFKSCQYLYGIKNHDAFSKLSNIHPCMGGKAHMKFGRLHLPVSPACNIQCRFCKRDYHNNDEERAKNVMNIFACHIFARMKQY